MSSCPPTWADTSATCSPASASSRGMACWSSPVPAGAFRWRSWCGRTDAPGSEAVHVLGLRRAAPDPRRACARRARAAAPARRGAGGVDLLPHVRLLPPAPRLHDRLRQRLRPVGRARDRRSRPRRAPRRRRPVRLPDARGAARATPRVHGRDAGRGTRMSRIDDYRRVARPGTVDFILKLAEQVKGRRFLHVTGGRLGGGAAETLRATVPILNELGIDARWEITGGDSAYYATARTLQAALEGAERVLSEEGLARWVDMNGLNA